MKNRKILALLLSLSMMVSAFSACDFVKGFMGGDSEENSVNTESSESTSEAHEHAFSDTWKHNPVVHWHACECGEKTEITKHSGGTATCEEKAVCEVCGREYGAIASHSFGALKELEEGVMGYECVCGEKQNLLTVENEDGTTQQGLLDFVVEVEEGRDPVILQLTDPQICNWGNLEEMCYKYVRETVQATKPDLIIITGDVVYGRFDPTGSLLTSIIDFMETLETPWAPVFGNHDNESLMGVDWQCEQLEAAEYCLFRQGNVTGNGNYSVGVMQGGEILRVFYMMDSNGCGAPMCDENGVTTTPAAGTNVVKTSAGFADNQIKWYTDSITMLSEVSPITKYSIAYHIQQSVFAKAYAQYGYSTLLMSGSSSELKYVLNFDAAKMIDAEAWKVEKELEVKEGDIGYLGRAMKGPWDQSQAVFNGMKNLGVDSLFVGHEHCNSASVVWEGIRFQYGQKSSTYDRYNSVDGNKKITGAYSTGHPQGATPLIGGTAFSLSQEDGSILNPYIYLCGDPLGTNPKNE